MAKIRRTENQNIGLVEIFLGVLAIMLISVSFYQTWIGLSQIFGSGAIMVALVLSLLMLFLCYLIRDYKIKGKKTSSLVGIYLFVASFCFVANFNALYTRLMKQDIYMNEMKNMKEHFSDLETQITANLSYKYPKNIAQQIEIKKKQMMEQIKDPANTGIGERALALIRDLENLLGQKVDLLTVKDNDYNDLAIRMGNQIDNMVMDLSPDEKKLKNDINSATLKWNNEISKALDAGDDYIVHNAPALVETSLADYNKIGNQANAVLGPNKMEFENEKTEIREVGKMGYAFKHALNNFSIYTVLILMGCILLDFVIVILILLMSEKNTDNPRVGRNRNNGHTII